MSIETIQQSFTESERSDLDEFEQRFRRVASGKHLADWLKMIPGLVVLSKAAMAYSGSHERRGRGYNETFAALVLEHARKVSNRVSLKEIEAMKPSSSYLLWLSEGHGRLAVLDSELDKLPLSRRLRIASPVMAYKLVKAVEDAAAVVTQPAVSAEAAATLLEQQRDEDGPTPTEEEMLKVLTRSLRKRGVNQTAVALLLADFDMFKDLAEALNGEIRAARLDAKDEARRKATKTVAH